MLLWEGKPIDALFHSTSGGTTLDAAEVFGKPMPYLVGVDDPHSALSPVNRWGPVAVAETTLRKGLKLAVPVKSLQLARGPSGRVSTVQVTTATGTTKITGAALRLAGGLRSTWVTQLVTLSLTRPGGPVRYGKTVALTGRANGVKGALLQQRVDGVWTKVAGPALKAKVKLLAPASFRIAAGKLAGSVLKVPVAPARDARASASADVSGNGEAARPGRDRRASAGQRATAGRRSRRRRPESRATTVSERARARALPRPGRARAGVRRGPLGPDRAAMIRIALVLVAAALLAPQADAARYAVGAASAADLRAPPGRAARRGEPGADPGGRGRAGDPPRLRDLPGAVYVERLGSRRPAYVPNDVLAPKQWHLEYNRTFDFWETPTILPAVRVAVIDSGIDGDHPDFAGKIADAKSFVGGSARVDEEGHGTFVAGLIAAGVNNTVGIAGAASSAELLVAKVVDGNDLIDVEAEVKAIRWAVEHDAQVINMSLGGFRDPRDPDRDAFSPLEAQAVGWAHGRGVVIVAAVGNNTDTPPRPWPYASYPAALPHVLGVSALARDGSVPVFSHRDKIYVDIAAPGVGILSTFPRALTAETKECPEQGYSSCAPDDFRKGQGTSFAAPQVSAAAAVLLAVRPNLRPEQVTELLTRTAHDVNGATGCPGCAPQRDALTGWGRLDVNAALKQLLSAGPPPRDRLEPNDDAGDDAAALWGKSNRIEATLDFWDDQNDVYAIRLKRGQKVFVSVRGPAGTDTNLILWRPRTKHVDDLGSLRLVARQSARPGPREHLSFRAPKAGTYYVQVKLGSRGAGKYRLTLVKK